MSIPPENALRREVCGGVAKRLAHDSRCGSLHLAAGRDWQSRVRSRDGTCSLVGTAWCVSWATCRWPVLDAAYAWRCRRSGFCWYRATFAGGLPATGLLSTNEVQQLLTRRHGVTRYWNAGSGVERERRSVGVIVYTFHAIVNIMGIAMILGFGR